MQYKQPSNLLLRRQHHHQLATFHLRELLDHCEFGQVVRHAPQLRHADFLVSHFTAPKTQCNLGLIAFFKKLDEVAKLDLVIAFVRTRTELDFLDLDLLLLQLGFVLLFAFLVLELAVVHDLAHGRLGRRCNFNQIQVSFFRLPQRIVNLHNAKLLAFHTDQPHLRGCNFTIDACLLLFCRDEPFSK